MMHAAPEIFLGRVTEARLSEAFADAAQITAKEAAQLLRLDVKTLRAMTDARTIRAVLKGKRRVYTEADIRLYLATPAPERESEACPSTGQKRARTGNTTSSSKVVAFTDLLASKHGAKQKTSSGKSASGLRVVRT